MSRGYMFPGGAVTVAAIKGSRSASATKTVPAPSLGATGPAQYLTARKTSTFNGIATTFVDLFNGSRGTSFVHPRYFVVEHLVVGGSGDRVDLPLTDSILYLPAFVGATLDLYRVTNDELAHLRSSTITGGNISAKYDQLGALNVVTGTSADAQMETWADPTHTYYYGVAAVDAGGQIGSIAWASYTPAGALTGAAPANTTTALGSAPVEGGPLAAPANLAAVEGSQGTAHVRLTWTAVSGAVGYKVFFAYVDGATLPSQQFVTLASDGGPAAQAGDLAIIRRLVTHPTLAMFSPRAQTLSSFQNQLVYGLAGQTLSSRTTHTISYPAFGGSDAAPSLGIPLGTHYLRSSVKANQTDAALGLLYWHGSPSQNFRDVLDPSKTYRAQFVIRASRPVDVRFRPGVAGSYDYETISIGTSWQVLTREFSPTGDETETNQFWALLASTTGAAAVDIDLALATVYEASTPLGDLPATEAAWLAVGMLMRDHNGIKDDPGATDVQSLTNPPGTSSRSTSLEHTLRAAQAEGKQPWLQIEWYHTPSDWLDILAYLAAPVSSGHPMALKRQANGRTAPWVDAFDRILFEFGNEAWNGETGFRYMVSGLIDSATAQVYDQGSCMGLVAGLAARTMEASPYWSDKIEWVIGGWAATSWSASAAATFKRPVIIGISNYQLGWDSNAGVPPETDAGYQSVLSAPAINNPLRVDHLVTSLKAVAAADPGTYTYGTTLRPATYEGGPGYALSGLNGATVTEAQVISQEAIMKSQAAAVAALDAFLDEAAKGFAWSNWFAMIAGDNWSMAAKGADGSQLFLPYQAIKIVQDWIGDGPVQAFGAMTRQAETISVLNSAGNSVNIEAIFAHGLVKGSEALLVIGNRSQSATLRPTIHTPWRSAVSAQAVALTGDLRRHNRYPAGQRRAVGGGYTTDTLCQDITLAWADVTAPNDLAEFEIDAGVGATASGLPPGSAVILRLTGVSTKAPAVVAFSPASLFANGEDGAWFDPSDLSTLAQSADGTGAVAVGDPVGYVQDKSGNAAHVTASAGISLQQDGNGFYYLDGSSSSSALSGIGTWAPGDDFTVFVACQTPNATNNYGPIAINPGSPVSRSVRAIGFASANQLKVDVRDANVRLDASPASLSIFEGAFERSPSQISASVNGGAIKTEAKTIADTETDFSLFRGITNVRFVGRIYGALIVNRTLTALERSNLLSYYASKTGITL